LTIPHPNDEILAIKRQLAAQCGNDLHRIAEDIRNRKHEEGREVVPLPPRRRVVSAATSQPMVVIGQEVGFNAAVN
jgi:hypothetical protein